MLCPADCVKEFLGYPNFEYKFIQCYLSVWTDGGFTHSISFNSNLSQGQVKKGIPVYPLSAYTPVILDCTAICWEGYIVQVSGPLERGVAEITESLYSSVPGVKELHVKYQIPVLPWLSAICLEFQGSFE